MHNENIKLCKCRLCGGFFPENEMSEEHYPAKSVGNDDIVQFDITKMFDLMCDKRYQEEVINKVKVGKTFQEISDETFDEELSKPLYPKGRTAKTLCRSCNTFLGKYDEAYFKFFNVNGDSKIVRGYQQQTKYQIIKAIFAKFLSIPETQKEEFDFIDFIRNESSTEYNGEWKVYFVKRDFSSDLMGFKDINTGEIEFDEGIVYEFSDDKFIYNLMKFEKHECYPMTNIFEILKSNYSIVQGVGDMGGYHGQLVMLRTLSSIKK